MNMRVDSGQSIAGLQLLGRGALDELRQIRDCKLVAPEVALTLWQGLLDGQWALLAHADKAGERLLLARRNRDPAGVPQLLSAREQSAAKLAVLGHSTKYISYELGVAVSTASTLVWSAIKKLGLRSRVELTEIFGFTQGSLESRLSAHTFGVDGEAYVLFLAPLRKLQPPSCLTEAEREVVRGVLNEKSNAEIAHARRTSVNTVANQLRAVYSKLGISGRSELICAC